MTNTTNYNFNIVEGTDVVNPLVQLNPNFTNLDSILKSVSDATISPATCIKSGTTHTIVRSNADANVFKFTATGDWNTGDTMIVDGVTVSAFLPTGEALTDGAYLINTEVLAAISGTRVTVYSNLSTASTTSFDSSNVAFNVNNVQDAIEECCDSNNIVYENGVSVNTELDTLVAGKANKIIVNTLSSTSFAYDTGGKYWYSTNPITFYYGTRKFIAAYVIPSYAAISANVYINANNHICVAGVVTTNMQPMDSQYSFTLKIVMEDYAS